MCGFSYKKAGANCPAGSSPTFAEGHGPSKEDKD